MYIDKEKYTKHIRDNDKKIKIRKILDKVEIVLNKHSIQRTDFLDPYEVYLAKSVINRFTDLKYIIEGGYESAERKTIIIYPDYILKEDLNMEISSLKIMGNLTDLEHRDYLGSILNLGLKRNKLGDILVYDDYALVILKNEISDFVLYNLEKVKNKNVEIKIHNLEDIKSPEIEYKELSKFLISLRLDSLISSTLNLSRKESSKLINSGSVKVNFEIIEKSSKEIEEGDIISVKGYGRFVLEKIKGNSKSGRFICIINILL